MATRNWEAFWAPVSGTITIAALNQRDFWLAVIELSSGTVTIYWSDDGTSSGTSIVANDARCPYVEVVAQDENDGRTFSGHQHWGDMFPAVVGASKAQYSFSTEWDSGNSLWVTVVSAFGHGEGRHGDGLERPRLFYAYLLSGAEDVSE